MDPLDAAGKTAELATTHGVVGVLSGVIVALMAVVIVLWREAGKEREARISAQASHYQDMVGELKRKSEVEAQLVRLIELHVGSRGGA